MSLYEPSVRSSSSSIVSTRETRRFTTLEGWREIGLGVFAMGNNNIRMFSLRHQFDPEQFRSSDSTEHHARLSTNDLPYTTPWDAPPLPRIANVEFNRSASSLREMSRPVERAELEVTTDQPAQWRHAQQPFAPYHVLSRGEKWTLVAIIAAAGIIPVLTFNTFLPAMDVISNNLDVPYPSISLTITAFLAFQGTAPLAWGPLSDKLGRRAVYTSSLLIHIASTTTLIFSPNFASVLLSRALQAAGTASIVCTGNAIIQDISLPPERDTFFSVHQGFRNASLVLAPVLGGVITRFADFRVVFMPLLGLSGVAFVLVLLFLPETQRDIAGNGSRKLDGMKKPLIWRLKVFGRPAHVDERAACDGGGGGGGGGGGDAPPKVSYWRFLEPLRLLKEKDIVLNLLFSAIVFAIWMMVTVSTTRLFKNVFGLNEIFLGLVFIPNSLGIIAGSTLIGNLLSRDLRHACSNYKTRKSLPPSTPIADPALIADFPLEHTRLVRLPGLSVVVIISLSFYGFTFYYPSLTTLKGWVCIPLLLQFIISGMTHAICGVHQTLTSDLWPSDGCAAAILSNLVRFTLAAAGTAIVDFMLDGLGVGPAFLALGLVVIVCVPLPIVLWYWGVGWRVQRNRWKESGGSGDGGGGVGNGRLEKGRCFRRG